jgi:ubiquitin-protein ligase
MHNNVNRRVLKDINDGRINLMNEFGIWIANEENNFFRVHFVIPGPPDTPLDGGIYHGMIRLNDEHPRKPPNIYMITPNGRFNVESNPVPESSRGICTTFSSFHPETWTPIHNIESVIKGFVSLMADTHDLGIGAVHGSSDDLMKKYANESKTHLLNDIVVNNLFPDLCEQLKNQSYKSWSTHTDESNNNNESNDDVSNDDVSNDDVSNDDVSNDDVSNDDVSNDDVSNDDVSDDDDSNDDDSNDNEVPLTKKKTPVKKIPAKKLPAKKPVKKTPVTKTPVTKSVTKTPVTKSVTKTPVKKSVTKTPMKKTPVTKTPVKKTPVKTPVTKTPVKKTSSRNANK